MLYGYEVVRYYTDRPGRENMFVRVSECELSVCTVRVQYSMCVGAGACGLHSRACVGAYVSTRVSLSE